MPKIKRYLYHTLRLSVTLMTLGAFLFNSFASGITPAGASPVEGGDQVTDGLRAAIEEALGPGFYAPTDEAAKLSPSDGDVDDYFGQSVAVSGDTAVVGAYLEDAMGADSGSAYVFERDLGYADNWGQVKKLTASDGAADDRFGVAVAISGDTVLVGASKDDDNGGDSGSVYIFERDQGGAGNWGEVKKLTASDGGAGDSFGAAVSLDVDTALVGARYDNGVGGDSGSAYVFDRDSGGAGNWGEVKKLISSDTATGDQFGWSVAISGDTALVGANWNDDAGNKSGSAYIYERDLGGADLWGEAAKLTADDAATLDWFGYAVALDGDTALVGAMWDDDNGTDSGSAYLFERDLGGADNWGQAAKITASDAAAEDIFSYAVALSGDTALVAAMGNDDDGNSSGSAYLFGRDQGGVGNWGEAEKLTASDAAADDYFGYAVALDGDTALVGARDDDDNASNAGSAYTFGQDQGGAGNWGEVEKVTASDGAASDIFGWSVAISGDTALVGAPSDDDNGAISGSAYIFQRDQGGADNWGQVKKLTASDGAAGDSFGDTVALSGDTALVGAAWDDSQTGSAYLFERDQGGVDNWGEVKKLTASDGATGDWFGYAIALSGDIALAGAYADDGNIGSAYIFERDQGGIDNWGEAKKLLASDGAADDEFGTFVAISGDTALVGSPYDDDDGTDSGAAYLFERDQGGAGNWGEAMKLTASDAAADDYFGISVALNGDTALVGAYGDDDNGEGSGSAYIFERDQGGADNWGQAAKLIASDGAASDQFGVSVALSGDTALVGADGDDDDGINSGSSYIFERNQGGAGNWGQVKKISASDGAANDQFGHSVALSGDIALVGAFGDDDNGADSGSAYIYTSYLANGGFEDPLGAEWTEVVSANGDGRVPLNQAYEGSYIYLFKADGGLEIIRQTVAASGIAGDEYTLTFYFGGKNVDLSGKLGARVMFKNGGVKVDKKLCVFTPPSSSFSWSSFSCTLTATGAFDSIEVIIGIQNVASGMVGVDMAILNKTGEAP